MIQIFVGDKSSVSGFSWIRYSGLSFVFLLFFSFVVDAQESWTAPKEVVALLSKKRTDVNYYEEKVLPYILPELLMTDNNKKVTTIEEWEELRRPELLELFATQVHGKTPETPYRTEFKIVKEDPCAMNCVATLRLVDIIIHANSKSLTIHMGLFIPNNIEKSVPAFLLICNRPAAENIDFTREKKSEFWPAEEVIARGYAVAAFFNGDVDPDKDDNFQDGIHGLLDKDRSDESWGTIAAWAWGASRCMDYLVSDKAIRGDKIALVGHSRGGKTALWAGATDQRFAMICCNEAGCGGSSIDRRKYGETVYLTNKVFPHWFCTNYKQYNHREDEMPFDMHQLLALIAPRALYIASASEDLWADPKGQYLALYHSLPAFRLYDKDIKLAGDMPPLDVPVRSGQIAYHIRSGIHNLTLQDWTFYMDQADLILKKDK